MEGKVAAPQTEWSHHGVTVEGGLFRCLGIRMPQKAQKPAVLIEEVCVNDAADLQLPN